METAMQKLFDRLEYNFESQINEQQGWWDVFKLRYLELEKEQSINLIKQTCMFMGASIIDIEISKMEFEDIYNNYYNQK